MSLDYPPLNPQPVSLSAGSVHVTNLGVTEGLLASIDTNTSAVSDSVTDIQVTRNGEQLNRTYDIEQHEIQKFMVQELKLIRMILGEAFNNTITQEDI